MTDTSTTADRSKSKRGTSSAGNRLGPGTVNLSVNLKKTDAEELKKFAARYNVSKSVYFRELLLADIKRHHAMERSQLPRKKKAHGPDLEKMTALEMEFNQLHDQLSKMISEMKG